MLLVVCDSTPLIYLARLNRLDLLQKLHDSVLVPPAVWQEISIDGAHLPEGRQLKEATAAGWIKVESPTGRLNLTPAESEDLDSGEAEAIQLAIERHALLVIDEAHGREVATRLGLRITGTVGLLVRARREQLIPNLRDELTKLRTTTFRLSDAIYRDALQSVGEWPVTD